MMNKIIKYLDSNNINYNLSETYINIFINKDCEIFNGNFEKIIEYHNYIEIVNKYSYHPYELKFFYDRKLKEKYMSGKQTEIIAKLEKILKEYKII